MSRRKLARRRRLERQRGGTKRGVAKAIWNQGYLVDLKVGATQVVKFERVALHHQARATCGRVGCVGNVAAEVDTARVVQACVDV